MRYALNLPTGGAGGDPRVLADFAALAEEAGWDGAFLEDYVVYQGHQDWPTCDPWVALAAMALKTERIRIGTDVTPLARRRPWKVAREAVSLDQLSNGRLTLGVSIGDLNDPGFAHFGEPTEARVRGAMLDEALAVLTGLWSGQPFAFEGEHYRVREITFLPRPVQQPRIPVWVGGSYPHRRPMARAARWDGMCVYAWTPDGSWRDLTPDEVRDVHATIAAARTSSAPFDIVVGGSVRRPDWEAERAHLRAVTAAGATWWTEWIAPSDVLSMRAAIAAGPLRVD